MSQNKVKDIINGTENMVPVPARVNRGVRLHVIPFCSHKGQMIKLDQA